MYLINDARRIRPKRNGSDGLARDIVRITGLRVAEKPDRS